MVPDTETLLKRISGLARDCLELVHTFRFLATAVLALASAQKLGHKPRTTYELADRQRHIDELKLVCSGAVPSAEWRAGFYYNAAIMRIDACYERLLKAVIQAMTIVSSTPMIHRQQSKTERMARRIENDLQSGFLKRTHLESLRKEVNNLKHALFGQAVGDTIMRAEPDDLSNAGAALSELLAILENRTVLACLSSTYTALPPP